MKKFVSWKILAIVVAALGLGFYNLPAERQQQILPFLPESTNKINLGLDLQGGSQLDYKIDLREVPEADRETIVEGVQQVIEKRVNSLGVAEPNIYTSNLGDETHIIVELAETAQLSQEDVTLYLGADKVLDDLTDDERKSVSLEKAKATVGKTIQLEFKEKKDSLEPAQLEEVRGNADAALKRIQAGETYSVVAQEEEQAFPGKVRYNKSEYQFSEDIDESLRATIAGLEVGQVAPQLIEGGSTFVIDESGQAVQETGLSIVKLTDKKEELKTAKEVSVSHILIAINDERDETAAKKLADEVKAKLVAGEDFAAVAKEFSEDPSNKDTGGVLEGPVTGDGTYVFDFEQAALDLEKAGDLTDPVKTQFGFHIIKANEVKTDVKEQKYQYETLTYSTTPDQWKDSELTGQYFTRATVQVDQFFQPFVQIQFNSEGAALFEEITERNIGKPVAIFVGGELISAPTVQDKIAGGTAQISGNFTQEEAQNLARDLNTGAIPAPIILTGEYTIGATLGQEALNSSLFAGAIGLALVMVFMLAYYRLAGVITNLALIFYMIILIFLVKSELHLGLSLLVSAIVFFFLIFKIVNSRDSGWEKFLSFILSAFTFFFLTFLLKTGVVMTLAGIAGIILSIGMSVDANILIFERFKEELREGKTFKVAADRAFERAWTAVRDSNFSALITCGILFYFGSSIIRGFAFNLAAGILVSMFTAFTITRILLNGFVGKKIAENHAAFGAADKKKKPLNINFLKASKFWLPLSGVLVAATIIAIPTVGLNLGIDFKGGTLMEFKFTEPVTKDKLAQIFEDIEANINSGNVPETPAAATETPGPVDLTAIQILDSSENAYIVKSKYLSSEQHNSVIALMEENLPDFTELRFTTIGAVIGSSLLQKAMIAIVATVIMIVIYMGIAFRKVPKHVSPWRFGFSAIVALVHDIIIVTGLFIIFGSFFGAEIDALFITAMLTVFGYSMNDSIVIFDRIRENLIISGSTDDRELEKITNDSINQTMARSINTCLATVLTLIPVLIWGNSTIFYFVLALTLGIIIGTYSSIFVASPIMVKWNKWVANRKR